MHNVTHLVAASGVMIILVEVAKLSKKPFRTIDGVADVLSTDTSSISEPLYALLEDDTIEVIDLTDAYNRNNIIGCGEYCSTEYYTRVVVDSWARIRKKHKRNFKNNDEYNS